jgi:hypothetical protein
MAQAMKAGPRHAGLGPKLREPMAETTGREPDVVGEFGRDPLTQLHSVGKPLPPAVGRQLPEGNRVAAQGERAGPSGLRRPQPLAGRASVDGEDPTVEVAEPERP